MELSSEQLDDLMAHTASMLAHFSTLFSGVRGTLLQELSRVPMAASRHVVRRCVCQLKCIMRTCCTAMQIRHLAPGTDRRHLSARWRSAPRCLLPCQVRCATHHVRRVHALHPACNGFRVSSYMCGLVAGCPHLIAAISRGCHCAPSTFLCPRLAHTTQQSTAGMASRSCA